MDKEMRFRHIHLDFHTSEDIPGVGADFDPDEFADTLAAANVNSINLFARCHHGWLYYDSKVFPELVHPNLKYKNLLADQIKACHKRGIKTPVYVSVQWDNYHAQRNPEWLTITKEGKIHGTQPYEPGFYRFLCVNTPYKDFLKKHVEEILKRFDVDGMWFDIVIYLDCSCWWCRTEMLQRGIDPSDDQARKEFGAFMLDRFKKEMAAYVRSIKKDCPIFFNCGHIAPRLRNSLPSYSHLELESLASGPWGVTHFPLTVRYARTLGKEYLGMTGKFHVTWGDFHSFKHPVYLEYETMRTLALNAKICIGDQLHPRGRLCKYTYKLIGDVYAQVKQKEPYCSLAEPVVELAVFNPEEFAENQSHDNLPAALVGATQMLEAAGWQFDIIDTQADFNKYKLLILPDCIPVSKAFSAKLKKYLQRGGAILATFESGLDESKKQFDPLFGVSLVGDGPVDHTGKLARGQFYYVHNHFAQYILPNALIGKDLPATEHVMYIRGTDIKPQKGAQTLMHTILPYFDRTYRHYCSHAQAPSTGKKGLPAAVQKGRVIYFSHPIFTMYQTVAAPWCKNLLYDAMERLLPDKLLNHNCPTPLLTSINLQKQHNRWVVHLLSYQVQKSAKVEYVENRIACRDVALSVRTPKKPKQVYLAPQETALQFDYTNGRVQMTLPEFAGHQMVCIQF